MEIPAVISFSASALELFAIYGILLILDGANRLSPFRLIVFLAVCAGMSTVLDRFAVDYHFVFMASSLILMMKALSGKPFAPLAIDIVIASAACLSFQIPVTTIFFTIRINVLTNYGLMYLCLFTFVSIVFILNTRRGLVEKVQRIYIPNRPLAFAFIASLFLTLTIIMKIWNNASHVFWAIQWDLMGLVAANFLSNAFLFVMLMRQKREKEESAAYKEYGVYLKELADQLRSRQHEHRNQLQTILSLLQTTPPDSMNADALRYCRKLADETEPSAPGAQEPLYANEVMLGAILFNKKKSAEEKGIIFEYEIADALPNVKIEFHELAELLHNLLNNAFEAVENLASEDRIVNLMIGGNSIEALNRVGPDFDKDAAEEIQRRGCSTKGKDRGYGLANVNAIVKKYNGSLKINSENAIFSVEVLF